MADDPLRLWEAWRTRGDERAFEELVRPELGRAVALARSEGCPPGEAEDAVQESLVRLAREKSDVPGRVGVRGWFFGVVRDRARSRLRADRRRHHREKVAAAHELVAAEEPRFVLREEVDRALARLPDEEREAVRLRYLLDLEYREVAYVLGVSEGACRMRVLRALKRIRDVLGAGAGAALAAIVFPEPARASTLVSTAVAAVPVSAGLALGGTLLMTTTEKVVLAAVVAALLGGALGAGVVHHLESQERVPDQRPANQSLTEIVSLKADLAMAHAEIERLRSLSPAGPLTPIPSADSTPETPLPPAEGTSPGVRVRATDDRGAPVVGAKVVVNSFSGGNKQQVGEGRTDAAGLAVLAGLPEGTVSVEIWKGLKGSEDSRNGEGTLRYTNLTLWKVEGIKDVRLMFPAGIPVTGVVTHARTGPLADAVVWGNTRDQYGLIAVRAVTNADGQYRLELPPGEIRLRVQGKGLECLREWRVEVPQDAPEVRRDFLVGVPSLRVSVRHRETGEPIRAAGVLLEGPIQGSDVGYRHMFATDDNGECSREDRPPGKYRITVKKPGTGPAFAEVEVPDAGPPAEVEITLAPLVDVTVEVISPDGRPQAGPVNISWSAGSVESGTELLCDDNGVALLVQQMGPGEWRLGAFVKGVGRGSVNATITSGENRFRIQLSKE
jgi:RNA polymerase sigma-70 factor (ECF subfamily)